MPIIERPHLFKNPFLTGWVGSGRGLLVGLFGWPNWTPPGVSFSLKSRLYEELLETYVSTYFLLCLGSRKSEENFISSIASFSRVVVFAICWETTIYMDAYSEEENGLMLECRKLNCFHILKYFGVQVG
jgi:hypothetical protein